MRGSNLRRSALMAFSFSLLSFCPCLPLGGSMAVDVPFIPKEILIFGGNGFIGSSTVRELLDTGHKITLVNRGNWYWDSAFTVQPFVHNIKCDRTLKVNNCPDLVTFVSGVDKVDVVIDFSAYYPEFVAQTLDLLGGKTRLYIYMSSDSVYEVCVKNHLEPSRETDAVRPDNEETRQKLASRDSYGHRKLLCEEVLSSYRQDKGGPPYISLRLPDVVGPRDNTYRWWIYQLWIKLRPFLEKDVVVPKLLASKPMSLVYVKDVAQLIAKLVEKVPPHGLDQAFNLAMTETPTLLSLLEDMREFLNLTNVEIILDERPETMRLFPSVHLGPVDISKAEEVLSWQPTKWPQVLKETVEFYESGIKNVLFDHARKDMIRNMQTHFTSRPYDVIRGLNQVYGLRFPEPRDEL